MSKSSPEQQQKFLYYPTKDVFTDPPTIVYIRVPCHNDQYPHKDKGTPLVNGETSPSVRPSSHHITSCPCSADSSRAAGHHYQWVQHSSMQRRNSKDSDEATMASSSFSSLCPAFAPAISNVHTLDGTLSSSTNHPPFVVLTSKALEPTFGWDEAVFESKMGLSICFMHSFGKCSGKSGCNPRTCQQLHVDVKLLSQLRKKHPVYLQVSKVREYFVRTVKAMLGSTLRHSLGQSIREKVHYFEYRLQDIEPTMGLKRYEAAYKAWLMGAPSSSTGSSYLAVTAGQNNKKLQPVKGNVMQQASKGNNDGFFTYDIMQCTEYARTEGKHCPHGSQCHYIHANLSNTLTRDRWVVNAIQLYLRVQRSREEKRSSSSQQEEKKEGETINSSAQSSPQRTSWSSSVDEKVLSPGGSEVSQSASHQSVDPSCAPVAETGRHSLGETSTTPSTPTGSRDAPTPLAMENAQKPPSGEQEYAMGGQPWKAKLLATATSNEKESSLFMTVLPVVTMPPAPCVPLPNPVGGSWSVTSDVSPTAPSAMTPAVMNTVPLPPSRPFYYSSAPLLNVQSLLSSPPSDPGILLASSIISSTATTVGSIPSSSPHQGPPPPYLHTPHIPCSAVLSSTLSPTGQQLQVQAAETLLTGNNRETGASNYFRGAPLLRASKVTNKRNSGGTPSPSADPSEELKRILTPFRKVFGTSSQYSGSKASTLVLGHRHPNTCHLLMPSTSPPEEEEVEGKVPMLAEDPRHRSTRSRVPMPAEDNDVINGKPIDDGGDETFVLPLLPTKEGIEDGRTAVGLQTTTACSTHRQPTLCLHQSDILLSPSKKYAMVETNTNSKAIFSSAVSSLSLTSLEAWCCDGSKLEFHFSHDKLQLG